VAANARFNVRYDSRSVCVTCLRGEVRVERGRTVFPLPAGRQMTYADQAFGPVVAVDLAVVTAWHDGILIFDATPVTAVIAEVNRYRPGRIILTNAGLGRERFSARFRIASVDRVVGEIEQVFGARATVLPGGIVLLG
jgi:transmembrane sensor